MTTLLVTGDLSPQGRLVSLGAMSPAKVFGDFNNVIAKADLAIVNLESPLCRPISSIVKTGPALHGPPDTARFIAESGFGLACLANNHIMDFGDAGLQETFEALKKHNIPWVGAGTDYTTASEPYIASLGGVHIGILNFAENEWSTTNNDQSGASPLDPVRNYQAIRECRPKVDYLIVVCHGGHEMYSLPSPRMKELFRFYVDAGADAVINHHTHCISGYELYKDAPIFYSLGNFLFDDLNQQEGPWTRGMAVELELKSGCVGFRLHHFDQCTGESIFRLLSDEEVSECENYLAQLNKVIADSNALDDAFRDMASDRQRAYRSYLEPKISRLVSLAQRQGLLPSLISKRQRALLLNLIRCESHRDILIELLMRDVGNS